MLLRRYLLVPEVVGVRRVVKVGCRQLAVAKVGDNEALAVAN